MKKLLLGCCVFLASAACVVKQSVPQSQEPVNTSTVRVVDFQKEFLTQINKVRSEGCKCGGVYMPPVQPLTWNNQLQMAALGHAQDMARNNYFSHTSKNGDKIKERITNAGYSPIGFQYFTIGENIALGQRSIQEVMTGWLNSPGHCKNLMNPAFHEVGIAMEKYYWVQDFGARVPFTRKK